MRLPATMAKLCLGIHFLANPVQSKNVLKPLSTQLCICLLAVLPNDVPVVEQKCVNKE